MRCALKIFHGAFFLVVRASGDPLADEDSSAMRVRLWRNRVLSAEVFAAASVPGLVRAPSASSYSRYRDVQ